MTLLRRVLDWLKRLANTFAAAFRSEKAPYGLTVLFVVWGWTITHIVDGIRQDQIVVYSLAVESAKALGDHRYRKATVRLENLTRDKTFKQFVVQIRKRSIGDDIEFVYDIAPERARDFYTISLGGGVRSSGNEDYDVLPDGVEFNIPDLTPGAVITLSAVYRGEGMPAVVGSADGGAALKLAESGLNALIAKYEAGLLLLGALAVSVLLLRTLAAPAKQQPS